MHRPLSSLMSAAALLTAAPAVAAASVPTPSEAAQAYVQGRLALAQDDLGAAAERFDLALRADADERLKRQALDVALLGGDLKSAVRLANRIALAPDSLPGQGLADSFVALTRAAGAASIRDWRAYDAARTAYAAPGRTGDTGQLLATLLEVYGKAGRGDLDAAIAQLDANAGRGLTGSYIAEHRAHLLAIARRWPEAADAYAAIVAVEGATVARLRIAAAAAALEAGARDPAYRSKAIAILGGGAARDPLLAEARARLAANPQIDGHKLGSLPERPQQGLALAFLRVATDLSRERALPAAISFARLGTLVDPTLPDAWFVTADTLVRAGKPQLALKALDQAPQDEPWRAIADTRRAGILAAREDYAGARAIATRLAERPDAGVDDWSRLADIDRRDGRNADAARHYGRALALLPEPPGPMHAQLWFLRGSASELASDWAAAEADLRKALAVDPDNPLYLNYLGYSLLDRRVKTDEGRALIARAYKAAPDNGAIIDSMGWAEFIGGNYPEAVRLLEKARAAEPSDPTIADHLGDALWKAGRRIEARHAWVSAAALAPEPKLQALLARKLDFGLDVALASK